MKKHICIACTDIEVKYHNLIKNFYEAVQKDRTLVGCLPCMQLT